MPYLCGFWRFANANKVLDLKGNEDEDPDYLQRKDIDEMGNALPFCRL